MGWVKMPPRRHMRFKDVLLLFQPDRRRKLGGALTRGFTD